MLSNVQIVYMNGKLQFFVVNELALKMLFNKEGKEDPRARDGQNPYYVLKGAIDYALIQKPDRVIQYELYYSPNFTFDTLKFAGMIKRQRNGRIGIWLLWDRNNIPAPFEGSNKRYASLTSC